MNELAAQVGVTRVKAKSASPVVEAFVRRLEPRCQSGGLPERLRDAVSTYIGHGGVFSTAVLPPVPAVPLADASAASSCDRVAEADAAPAVMRHRLLEQGFRLKSKAFMLTFNSKEFTEATWNDFRPWVERKCRELGARRWAACLELSENAVSAAGGPVYHTHAYLWWTDGEGLQRRKTNDLIFEGVKPRVDVCTCQAPRGRTLKVAAAHGLW